MQKGLFRRYFTVCLSTILISIVTLGTMLMFLSSQYFRESEHDMLQKHADSAVDLTYKNLQQNSFEYVDKSIQEQLQLMSLSSSVEIMLLDSNGAALLTTSDDNNLSQYTVPVDVLNRAVQEGSYRGVGTLGNVYNNPCYFVAQPVQGSNGKVLGFIISTSSTSGMSSYLNEMLRIFVVSSAGVLVVATIIIYFVTKRIVKPLKEMAEATKAFAKGDFTTRVTVNDYDEVGQLAIAFNNMASSLSVNEVMHRSFVANVSHELKTPMTTIGGFIDGILDGTIPPERQSHYLKIVSDEVKRLSRLVVSMLNIARIEAGEMKISPTDFDIMETVLSVLFSFEQKIEKKQVEIRGLEMQKFMVNGDQDLIHQVVYNLVDNAIKFVPDGGYIEISMYEENNRVYVGIKNSGTGIPKEQIEHIFDRFYKTDKSRSYDKKGVGLGLYIVKNILNLHDGEIMVRSKLGEFSEFVFNIAKAKPLRGQRYVKDNGKGVNRQ